MDDLKNDLDLITEFICSFGTAYYRRRKGNTRDAQEFGQYFGTIFLEKYRRKEKLEPDWPRRNVRYFFLNFLGRYNDNRQIVPNIPLSDPENPSAANPSINHARTIDPLEAVHYAELKQLVIKVLETCNPRDQALINLRIRQYRAKEIVAIIQPEYGTITTSNIDKVFSRYKRVLHRECVKAGILSPKGERQ